MTEKDETIAAVPVENPPIEKEVPPPKKRSKALLWCTVVFIVLLIAWFFYWLLYLQFHATTDDAYANGNMVYMNSPIEGSVTAFYADNTDLVKEGEVLVKLDDTAYEIAFKKELATFSSVVLQVRQLYDTVHANLALVEAKRALVSKARYDYENRKELVDSLAISGEDFTHSKDDLEVAELELKQAEYQYRVSKDSRGDTHLSQHPLIEEQKNKVRQAYYNLKHCVIKAPCTGYVAQRRVEVGQSVTRSTNLMAVIPMDYVWVDANFKETELRKMRVGQPAKVYFDLYGSGVVYEGKVLGIASGTGSVFSLIPPQNATGNWIKIVQRLPVRISLDPETLKEYPLRLGISAEVDVDVTNQDLPRLQTMLSSKAVAKTSVFEMDFTVLNKKMDALMKQLTEE